MKDCADVAKELGLEVRPGYWPKECCNSCHDDRADGYPMSELTLPDGIVIEVCCRTWELYRKERP